MEPSKISAPIGNIKLLEHTNKTAFLTSRHTPRSCDDNIRTWLDSLNPDTDCVMVGNIQLLESHVFQGLLKRNIPTILVLSVPYPEMWPTYIVDAIGDGRLLIITIADFSLPWMDDYGVAADRNKYMIANAEKVVIGVLRQGGILEKQLVAAKEVVLLNDAPWRITTNHTPVPQSQQSNAQQVSQSTSNAQEQ